jgi:tetratricopeptide (TPR) repeat protein
VKCLVAVLTLLVAMRGEAKPEVVPEPTPTPDPDRGNFWREITEPHKEEVNLILYKARQALAQADGSMAADYDPTGEGRLKIYREVNGMLRYARRLAPDNLDVLRLLAQSADGLGKTRQALEALHAAIDLVGAEKAGPEITGHAGEIYLRLGQLDDAIRYLRVAQGPLVPNQPASAQVLIHLSNALAQRGQMADAIDVLANSLPANPPFYSNEMQLVAFALAVQYDRDEQRGAAFEVLDHLSTAVQGQLGPIMVAVLSQLRFAPAEEQQYYLGLLYEVIGHYAEARAEWALYAAADTQFRRRALDHIAAIDAQRHAPVPAAAAIIRRHRFYPMPVPP